MPTDLETSLAGRGYEKRMKALGHGWLWQALLS
jgi:hypothetical protein